MEIGRKVRREEEEGISLESGAGGEDSGGI